MNDEDLIVRQIGHETVVYDRKTHRAHCLAPLVAAVWRASRAGLSVDGIRERVERASERAIEEGAVRVALHRLWRAGLLGSEAKRVASDASRDTSVEPGGIERRRALRRVAGLTGLAVLTLATSAPAQAAATCIVNGSGPCTSSAQCCNNCCNANNNKCTGGGPCLSTAPAPRL